MARAAGLRVLWITPLRALAADTDARAARASWRTWACRGRVERAHRRHGQLARRRGSSSGRRPRWSPRRRASRCCSHRRTPQEYFASLRRASSSTSGTSCWAPSAASQTELCLARLRGWRPDLRLWGLSATLGNLDEALAALVGVDAWRRRAPGPAHPRGHPEADRGRLADPAGRRALPVGRPSRPAHAAAGRRRRSRSRNRRWSSPTRATRRRSGTRRSSTRGRTGPGCWRCTTARSAARRARGSRTGCATGGCAAVVATASLDLGVDFSPVDRVLQIGSPKGIARLLQRAGRSGHQPGALSRVSCVPTNALELVEAAAARDAAEGGRVEPRVPLREAAGRARAAPASRSGWAAGFAPEELLAEVRTAYAYRDLSDDGVAVGARLRRQRRRRAGAAYPEYRRLALVDGRYRVVDKDIAQRHRLSIGTITSDPVIEVKYLRGPSLGSTSESFISRLKPGDRFIFAGMPLEFVAGARYDGLGAPRQFDQGRDPDLDGHGAADLPGAERRGAGQAGRGAGRGDSTGRRCRRSAPVLRVQMKVSTLPAPGELLIERVKTREGYHLFFYPFAGKLVNAGLAALFAYRLSRLQPITFTTTANDYGFELLAVARPGPSLEPRFLDPRSSDGNPVSCLLVDRQPARRHPGQHERGRNGEAPVPRDRAGGRAWSSRASPAGITPRGTCRRRAACSTRCFRSTTRATCCWRRRSARCWRGSWSKAG